MKRIISIILLISMVTTMLPVNVSAANAITAKVESETIKPFIDVSESDWFYDSVLYVLEHGIFNGSGENTFLPHGTMTRAMYVTVMGRVAGMNPSDYTGSSGFTDVRKDAYYAPYVAWALEKGITGGVGNNRFDPDGIVNREQMAVLTVRFFEVYGIDYGTLPEMSSTPEDLSSVSPWARDSVLKLWKVGLFQGNDNRRFSPKSDVTRAEAATFCTRTNKTVIAWRGGTSEPTQFPTSIPSSIPSPSLPQSSAPDNGGNVTFYTVSFDSNGGSAADSIVVREGRTPSSLPVPKKGDAIFLGWYKDPGLQGDPFTDKSMVTSNITLYAKYMGIESISEEELDESFSLPEQEPSLTFNLNTSDADMTITEVESAILLEVADGSDPVELTVNGSNSSFVVQAINGFKEGASYKLTLVEPKLSFVGRDTHVKSCSFTIKKAEVFDLELNDGIVYIPDAHVKDIIKNNIQVKSLSVPLATITGDESGAEASTTGSFTYTGNGTIDIGDVLCIYSGQRPEPGDDAAYLKDDIAYIKVIDVRGDVISFSDADPEEVLFIPDMLPIYIGEGHTLTDYINNGQTGSFTTSLFNLDFEKFADLGLSADTTIDVGDYLVLSHENLTKAEDDDEADEELDMTGVSYAEVTSVRTEATMVEVEFNTTTLEEMQNARGYYSQNDLDGEQMLDNINLEELEEQIEAQVNKSGFVDKVAPYMAILAMSTGGFKEIADTYGGMESLRITMADGSAISANQFGLMAQDAKRIKIKDKKVSAKINQKPKNFDKGVHCEITVALTIQIQAGDDSTIEIKLSANFVEEIKITVNASGSEVWSKKKVKVGFVKVYIPYISDYSMNANIDIYNYTAMSFKAVVSTRGDVNSIDVSQQIQKLLGNNDKKEITNGVKELYEIYSDMMANGTDWIEIFDQEIVSIPVSLVWGAVQARVTVNFVAAANINVAIGCNYESKSGTRYCFWAKLKAHDIGTSTVELMDETYTFQFYVIGILGLRTGIKLEVAVGLFSLSLDSVGIEAEAGIFTRLYGFFFYEKKLLNNKVTSYKSGALYFELGAYLEVALTAQALNGKFKSSLDVLDKEWTLLTAGQRYNVFDFAYENPGDIIFTDKSKVYTIPDNTFSMNYLDLREGESSVKTYKIGDYIFKFTDNRFSFNNGKIEATVPSSIRYLECDMTVTWKHSPLAFSSVPISRTYKLIWDTLDKSGYTIYFESNGGGGVKSITKKYGEAVSAPNAPVKTGYTFKGWYTDQALKNAYTFSTMGWDDMILYAKWIPNNNTKYKVEHYQQDVTNSSKYILTETQILTGTTDTNVSPAVKNYEGFKSPSGKTVAIEADGSTVVEYKYTRNSYKLTIVPDNSENNIVQTLKFGASIKLPVLKKTGHTFTGWDKVVAGTMLAENLTCKALWKKNTYTITFDPNGGSTPSSINVIYDNKYGMLPIPVREGYAFLGWHTSEVDNVGFGTLITADSIVNITSAQILYAKWAGNPNTPYTVEHYLQNINDSRYPADPFERQSLAGTAGTEVTPEVKTYEGFNSPYSQTVTIAGGGSTVVKYYYTRNSYTLTIIHGNGLADSVTTVKYGDNVTLPADLVKTGYTFNGWNPEPASTMPAHDITYTAIWEAKDDIPYKVEHYKEDLYGNYSLADTENLQGITDASVIPPTKVYEGFTAPITQSVTILVDGSTVVKYYYTRNSYTLTFDANGGTGGTSASVKYGSTIAVPTIVRTGYTFNGWNPEPASTMPAHDITYTAIWEANDGIPYKVEHYKEDLYGNYSLADTDNLQGITDASVTPPTMFYEGFTAPITQSVTILVDGSTVVKYYYTRISYTLTFDANGGTGGTSASMKYGATIVVPTIVRTGYTFNGWNPEPASTMPAHDITYTAIWEANDDIPYKVEHYKEDLHGNYSLADTDNLQGITDASVTPPTKVYEGFTAPVTQTVTILVDGSTIVKYYYTRNSYTLTTIHGNGLADSVTTVKYGDNVTLPADLVKIGYTFKGWNPEPASTMPANDITYTAIWEANKYTVTFDSNGDTEFGFIEAEVTYGSPYGELPIPKRSGFNFVGWYDDETNDNGSGTLITSSTVVSITSTQTLYAKWDSVGEIDTPEMLAAVAAVENAERSKSHNDVLTAKGLVAALTDEDVKETLQTRLNAIVVIYNLSLNNGKIIIYPNKYEQNGVQTQYVNKTFKFVITGQLTGSTPLQIYNDTDSPVTYDITLSGAKITGNTWATAVRIDYGSQVAEKNNSENLIVNLTIDGDVSIKANNHPGLQCNGKLTVNLTGTENSTFYCADSKGTTGYKAVSPSITLNLDTDSISEIKVNGTVTSDVTLAYSNGPFQITFR